MKKALLVIDVDHGDGWPDNLDDCDDAKKRVAAAIVETIQNYRALGDLIAFIILVTSGLANGQEAQYPDGHWHDSYFKPEKLNGCLVCDCNTAWQLAKFLRHNHASELEPAFVKTARDAFTNKNLLSFLRKHEVTDLQLVGCMTRICVEATAAGALKEKFNVKLLAKASYPLQIQNDAHASWWIEGVKRLAGLSNQDASISVAI